MSIFSFAKNTWDLLQFKKQWRRANSHNGTYVKSRFPMEQVTVGKKTYGCLDIQLDNNINRLQIGNYCSVAENVRFLVCADHNTDCISTFPFRVHCLRYAVEAVSKGDILVDDDVWIGYGSTILSGVHIGQGAVIAAGSVVAKDVPPYAIVGGVPAKVIKYRFAPEMIEELLRIDYSRLDDEAIRQQEAALYTPLTDPAQLAWLPKKAESPDR